MPPTPEEESPSFRKRYCGLGDHYLRPPHKTIQDERVLRFARRINAEIRNTTLVCGNCLDTLEKIYKVKHRHKVQQQKALAQAKAQTNSISDVSSSQQQSQQSAGLLAMDPPTISSSSSSTSLTTINEISTTTATTSAKRKRLESVRPDSNSRLPEDDNDAETDDDMLSLNAVNGTRLPHVQPIPKRRQTVHLNQPAMDIYLAGTTGG